MAQNETDKQTIIKAVNILAAHDPNFAYNIQKLAQLCVSNPFIYKQAVKKLNSL